VHEEERWANQLSEAECAKIYFDWHRWAHKQQLPPPGDWVTWLLMGGRSAGKTMAGAEWVRGLAAQKIGPIALVGESITEAIAVMVRGPSGLLAVTPHAERPRLSEATLYWPNGVEGIVLGANEPERFRGPQFAAAWCDEFGCGAVDKAANQPNVSGDPKSAESAVPYFSTGGRTPWRSGGRYGRCWATGPTRQTTRSTTAVIRC